MVNEGHGLQLFPIVPDPSWLLAYYQFTTLLRGGEGLGRSHWLTVLDVLERSLRYPG